jgi:hypothetical protein
MQRRLGSLANDLATTNGTTNHGTASSAPPAGSELDARCFLGIEGAAFGGRISAHTRV